jgi:hypothetical protein
MIKVVVGKKQRWEAVPVSSCQFLTKNLVRLAGIFFIFGKTAVKLPPSNDWKNKR